MGYWILEDKSSRYLYQLFFLVFTAVRFVYFLHGIIVSVMKATMKNVISQFIGHEVQVIYVVILTFIQGYTDNRCWLSSSVFPLCVFKFAVQCFCFCFFFKLFFTNHRTVNLNVNCQLTGDLTTLTTFNMILL